MDYGQLRRESQQLSPNEIFAELLALSVVEHSFIPTVQIVVCVHTSGGVISDTGRGMRLTPDPSDELSHAERALTGVYPCLPANPEVEKVLTELIWGARGSLGPALANFACPSLQFTSQRDGEMWSQRYRYGIPLGSATMLGRTETTGTTITFEASAPLHQAAIFNLIDILRSRVPGLAITAA